jgi:intein/homing endonuclease
MPKQKLPDKDFEWSPELAYAIGLLTTDGNLSKDGRHIDFTSKDKVLVELFRECLHLDNKIGRKNSGSCHKKKYHRIQFGNVVFYRWLQRLGLTSNKSKSIGILKIPNEYFADFLRGYLDGDGSVNSYTDYWNTFKNPKYVYIRLWTRFYSASRKHILWLRKKIIELTGIKGHLWEGKPSRPDQTVSEWVLKLGKKDSIKLLSWIYYRPNIPCLLRKRKIAEKFI